MAYDKEMKIKVTLDDAQARQGVKDIESNIKKLENNKIKISTSVDKKEFTSFEAEFNKIKNQNAKINLGVKVNNVGEIPDLQKRINDLRQNSKAEIVARFNIKQDLNQFNQIKKSIEDIKAIEKFQLVLKFGEIGLSVIKNALDGIKSITGTLFDGLKFNNSFADNKVGLTNALVNQGQSKELARTNAGQIQKSVSDFTDVTPFKSQEGFQVSNTLLNAGFDILKGTNGGQTGIKQAGYDNILNIVADLASRQQTTLGKSSYESIQDVSRALVELQGGQTVSLKSRFNIGNKQIEEAVNRANLTDKLDYKINKQTGEGELIKNSFQNLNPEDLTKFFAEISKLTNSQGLAGELSQNNTGLISTIQEKLDKKILAFFGQEDQEGTLSNRINNILKKVVDFFGGDGSREFDGKLQKFGERLGKFADDLITPENLKKFGDALISFADTVLNTFTPENGKKFVDAIDGILKLVSKFFPNDKKDGESKENPTIAERFELNPVVKDFLSYEKERYDNFTSGLTLDFTKFIIGGIKSFGEFKADVIQKYEDIKKTFNELKLEAIKNFTEIVIEGQKSFGEFKADVIQKYEDIKTEATAKFNDLKQNIKNNIQEKINSFEELKNSVIEKVEFLKNSLNQKYEDIKTQGIAKFNELKESVKNNIQEKINAFEELRNDAINRIEELKNSGINSFNDLKNSGVNKFNELRSQALERVNSIGDGITDFVNNIPNKLSGISQYFTDAFNNSMESVKNLLSNIQLPQIKLPEISLPSNLEDAKNAVSSFFGGGRATGGPVFAGSRYTVNEEGSELFVTKDKMELLKGSSFLPSENGFILPHDISNKVLNSISNNFNKSTNQTNHQTNHFNLPSSSAGINGQISADIILESLNRLYKTA